MAQEASSAKHVFLVIGGVNRASSVTKDVGGKGQQVAKALHFYRPNQVMLAQFLGGNTGKWIEANLATKGFEQITVHVASETRVCSTLLGPDNTTEVIDPSEPIFPHEVEELEKAIAEHSEKVSAIIISGTYPPGVPPTCYANIISQKKNDAFVLLDGYKGVEESLATNLVDVLKINLLEIRLLTKIQDVEEAAVLLFSNYKIKWLAVTDGKDAAHLFGFDGTYFRYTIPELSGVVNPIGAGDTVSAVFSAHVVEGKPVQEAFRYGLAAASASCLELEGARFSLENFNKILPLVKLGLANRELYCEFVQPSLRTVEGE